MRVDGIAAVGVARGLAHLCTHGTWRSAGWGSRRRRDRDGRRPGRATRRSVRSRARRRIASRKGRRFAVSGTYPGSGSSRTSLRRDCRCKVGDGAEVDVRISRCACTLRGHSYRLRAAIDTI